jgi:KaiC/GvpD/RAD55 family RecA-like ATPase
MSELDWLRNGLDDFHEHLSGSSRTEESSESFLAVIAGVTGTGKSTLALQICCGYVRRSSSAALYFSASSPDRVHKRLVGAFGCFGSDIPISSSNPDELEAAGLHILQLPANPHAQAECIRDAVKRATRPGRPAPLVCIDPAGSVGKTVLETDPFSSPEAVGSSSEVLAATRALLGEGSTYLVVEQDEDHAQIESLLCSRLAQAADAVVALGVDVQSPYRMRYLEILKSRRRLHLRGRHGFSIVGKGDSPEAGAGHGSILGVHLYPSLAAQLLALARDPRGQTAGNDAEAPREVRREPELVRLGIYTEGEPEREFTVPRKTCTVIVSDISTAPTRVGWCIASRARRALYVSFLHRTRELSEPVRAGMRSPNPPDPGPDVVFRYFPPGHVNEGKLMWDIDGLITKHDPEVVILDDTLDLGSKYPLMKHPSQFLAALAELFRVRGRTSFIIDSVEVGVGHDPIAESFAAGLGENVILLRSMEFQSRTHTVFSFQRHCADNGAQEIWHLDFEQPPKGRPYGLSAKRTFDAYKNVLSGNPEPVTFALGLFRDAAGSVLTEYLDSMVQALRRTFARSIELEYYGSHEYAKVQSMILNSERSALADCHLMAIDEFWLTQLIRKNRLEDISPFARDLERATLGEAQSAASAQRSDTSANPRAPELGETNPFVTAACDIATFDNGNWPFDWYAVPFINNFGILCCDPVEVRRRHYVEEPMEQWLSKTGQRAGEGADDRRPSLPMTWDSLVRLKARARHLPNAKTLKFFTFCMDQMESIVSMLLVLALSETEAPDTTALSPGHVPFRRDDSAGAKRVGIEDLVLNLGNPRAEADEYERNPWRRALDVLLSLLDEDDLVTLAALQTRAASEEPIALFSRQWVGSLASLRSLNPDTEATRRLQAYELPAGRRGVPTPVSGTWYLAILRGSAALAVGVQLLEAFCNVDSDITKWNLHLSAPVSKGFYKGATPDRTPYGPFDVPYSVRFHEIGRVQGRIRGDLREAMARLGSARHGERGRVSELERELLDQRERAREDFRAKILEPAGPFYRMRVRDYGRVSTVLWRMMARAAREWLSSGLKEGDRATAISSAISVARGECEALGIATAPPVSAS